MNKTNKQQVIENLTKSFGEGNYFYFTDTSGLTVEQINKLRRTCFKEGVQLQVAKNTLIKIAMTAVGKYTDELDVVLAGPTAIMFTETGNLPAKLIKTYRKTAPKPILKGAYIDSAIFVGDDQLDTLTNLKTKDELVGEIIGLLQSPIKNVVSALQSGPNTIAGLVKALGERAA
jgi:large subunit ribosomal protein L10